MINRKIDLYLEPQSLEVKYQKSLKFQIAIFRMSKEESKDGKRPFKIDKTDPVKYNNPNQKITFNKTLVLMTTIAYDTENKKYQDKEIDFQLALDVDGKKDRIAKKINLNQIAQIKTKNQKFTHDTAMIVFNCRIYVKFSESEQQNIDIRKSDNKRNSKKVSLRIDSIDKQTLRHQKARGKTIFLQSPQGQIKNSQLNSQKNKNQVKKCKSFNTMETVQQKCGSQTQENASLNRFIDSGELKHSKTSKNQILQILEQQNRQLAIQMKEKDIKLGEFQQKIENLSQKYSQLQIKMASDQKQYKKQKQEHKQQSKNNEHIISALKEEIKAYKQQTKKYKSQLQFFTTNSTSQSTSSQEMEIKQLKQLNSILTKNNDDYYKELTQLQNEIKHKDRQISQYKNKVYELDNENLVLSEQHKSLQNRYNKIKNESNEEMIEIVHKINELKEENKSLKIIPSSKDIKDDGQYRKKCQILEKQVQKKEQLIKKMMQMKRQLQAEKNNEISHLKKQINTLKQQIEKLQNDKDGQRNITLDIETKILMQKMKKQLQTLRKNQKGLLIQKNKLETSNRSLQDDLIKNKNTLANIINAVQQTQNQKLITQVYNLIE